MNLNEIQHYEDATDQWAAEREYELRERAREQWIVAEAWAANREAWMRAQPWMREKMRRTAEQIRVAFIPAVEAFAAAMKEAEASTRRFLVAVEDKR